MAGRSDLGDLGGLGKVEDLGDFELDDDAHREMRRQIAQAERDISELQGEVRINFRWGRDQLEVVKRAADVYGVPYQTYLKVALIRQALADLKEAAAVKRSPRATPPA